MFITVFINVYYEIQKAKEAVAAMNISDCVQLAYIFPNKIYKKFTVYMSSLSERLKNTISKNLDCLIYPGNLFTT